MRKFNVSCFLLITIFFLHSKVYSQEIEFTPHTIVSGGFTVQEACSIYAADVDGDGDMDVLSASYSDNKIAWYENLQITGINEGNNLILMFNDLSNYPNPFNPTTTINYSLKENSKVSLNIYNIKGQKVKQLVSDHLPSGQHSVVWDGNDDNGSQVSSGIYFYKLNVNGKTEPVKKCLLLK